MNWISVKEKLPPNNKYVLCWDSREPWGYERDGLMGSYNITRFKSPELIIPEYITHWMLLPEPPKS